MDFKYGQNLPTLYTTYELSILNAGDLNLLNVGEVELALFYSGHNLESYTDQPLHSCLFTNHAQTIRCTPGTFGPCRNELEITTPTCVQRLSESPRACPSGFVDCEAHAAGYTRTAMMRGGKAIFKVPRPGYAGSL